MKQTKKLLALALALAMTLALAVPAFAADGDPVAIPGTNVSIPLPGKPGDHTPGDDGINVAGHTYVAYQVFAAEYAKEMVGSVPKDAALQDSQELVGIKWGSGINAQALLAALQANAAFGTGDENLFAGIEFEENDPDKAMNPSALKVAEILSGWENDSVQARAFAAAADACVTGTPVQKDGTLDAGYYLIVDTSEGELRNLSTLIMSNAATPFEPRTKVDVPELEKKVLQTNDSVANTAGWGDFADYDISDIVPFVLTGTVPTDYSSYTSYRYVFHDSLSAGLSFNADSVQVYVNGVQVSEENYTVATAGLAEGESFTVTFEDLKTVLPDTAVTDATTVQVLYTAVLTGAAITGGTGNTNEAYLQYSNNPNYRGGGENEPTGNTPKDVVTVFTFQLNANKVDENNEALTGAGFTLYKLFVNPDDVPDAPALPEGAASSVSAKKGTYYPVAVIGAADGRTVFEFKGLDAGEYMLSETTVPSGYNRAEDMFFTVTAVEVPDGEGGYKVESLTVSSVTDANDVTYKNGEDEVFTITAEPTAGMLETTVTNLRGVILPSTGGIGTTIFYVAGGLLLIGAGVVLIAKKRMQNAE